MVMKRKLHIYIKGWIYGKISRMKLTKIQIIGHLAGLLPGLFLLYQVFAGTLSANPIQTATVITGRASVYAILISLYCSPLALYLRLSVFHRIRKISGLFGFYYAFVHFLVFALFDYQLNLQWILPEIKQKPFLQIGLAALFFLALLAVTSIDNLRTKLGTLWKKIHFLTYPITALILLHVALASKGDLIDPALLIGIFLIAMLLRLPHFRSLQIKSTPDWLRNINTELIK